MAASKFSPIQILPWVAGALVAILVAIALVLTSSLELVGKSGGQITQVIQHLNSVDSLKTILVTYSSQYQRAEIHWMEVVNQLLFLLFLVAMLAVGLLVALTVQLRRGRALQERVRRLKQD